MVLIIFFRRMSVQYLFFSIWNKFVIIRSQKQNQHYVVSSSIRLNWSIIKIKFKNITFFLVVSTILLEQRRHRLLK